MKEIQHSIPTSSKTVATLEPVFLKLPPKQIVFLKFILDTYEGLGILRTLNPITGEVVILAISDTLEEVHTVIASLASNIEIREIPPPKSVESDWLMSEEIDFTRL